MATVISTPILQRSKQTLAGWVTRVRALLVQLQSRHTPAPTQADSTTNSASRKWSPAKVKPRVETPELEGKQTRPFLQNIY